MGKKNIDILSLNKSLKKIQMWPLIVYDQLNNIFSQNTLQDPQIYWNPSWRLKLDQLLKEIQYYTYTYLTICIIMKTQYHLRANMFFC